MVVNLFPDFLTDEEQYRQSEEYWMNLWHRVDHFDRQFYHWTCPWLGTGSPAIRDGNPIFKRLFSDPSTWNTRRSAGSVGQSARDIHAYPDYFGGIFADPSSINELVIACTLSDEAAKIALRLLGPWVAGRSIIFENAFDHEEARGLVPRIRADSVKTYRDYSDPAA